MRQFTQILFPALLTTAVLLPASVDIADENPDKAKNNGCELPDIDEISSIVADLYCHPFAPLGAPDIADFHIPREKFSDVLQYFKSSRLDDKFLKTEKTGLDLGEIGTLRINLKHGGCIRICWFDWGQNRLHFSCTGRRYERVGDWIGRHGSDETLNVDGRIRKLHNDLSKKTHQRNRTALTNDGRCSAYETFWPEFGRNRLARRARFPRRFAMNCPRPC
jgi:hypothetical protein